ncbi:hypothetical protein O181_066018 [Austropuccinia psidii MF-1]|uniref:Uncharacterized protein n=1 Tax=Austropuccinia psidii MF-1 TaxID=1389203 RepID=A0A9Q3EWC7_9BASI|nr:hypothetical protein [Austropuccinia psidii MF-1]
MELTIIHASNQKYNRVAQKKKEVIKEEAPVAPNSKPKVNKPLQEGKKNWKKPYSPSYKIQIIQKDAIKNVFNMARTLIKFKGKEEQRMKRPSFPKKECCVLRFEILDQELKVVS